jgi:sporulation protein YlmC with PRC-barrel domain
MKRMTFMIDWKPAVGIVAASLALGAPAMAQMGPQPGVPPQEAVGARHLPAQAAEQCLMDLDAFTRRANQEGYWLTGWGTQGPPWMAERAATGVLTPGAPGTAAAPPPVTRGPAVTAERGVVAPRGRPEAAPAGQLTGGSHLLPRVQIRALVYAASILGHRGAEEGCQAVLRELLEIYDGYVAALREAGVGPGELVTWRQEQLITAVPVAEMAPATFRTQHFVGTDVRNADDVHLGDIEDILVDPHTGEVSYAIVARGGFLGAGQDHVAVPWRMLRVTPWMNMFVLDVPESVVDAAPQVDPEAFADPAAFPQYRQAVDRYWAQYDRS